MLKKKFYLNELEQVTENGINKMEGFTDDSYVVIDIPSMREKLELRSLCRGKKDDEIEAISIEKVFSMVVEVHAETIEGDLVRDMDHLTVYPIPVLMHFLESLLRNGYVPKKSKSG